MASSKIPHLSRHLSLGHVEERSGPRPVALTPLDQRWGLVLVHPVHLGGGGRANKSLGVHLTGFGIICGVTSPVRGRGPSAVCVPLLNAGLLTMIRGRVLGSKHDECICLIQSLGLRSSIG